MALWAPVMLVVVTAALLAVPVAPALYELKRRRDAAPLPTSRHDGRIENFAKALRYRLEPLRPQLAVCCRDAEVLRADLEGMHVLLVGRENFDFNSQVIQGCDVILCGHATRVPDGRVIEADICTDGSLYIGAGSTVRAAAAQGDVILAKNSRVLRWLHAKGNIQLCENSASYGRMSAGQTIQLARGCGFERMHAPSILVEVFGDEDARPLPPMPFSSSSHRCSLGTPNSIDDPSRKRLRIDGDFSIPPNEVLVADVIATGTLRLCTGGRMTGRAKSHKMVVLEPESILEGSIVSQGKIRIEAHSAVSGPVVAEDSILVQSESCVGAQSMPTTVSANRVTLGAGCELHGTVWARERGMIEA